jgi:hypothetical protein
MVRARLPNLARWGFNSVSERHFLSPIFAAPPTLHEWLLETDWSRVFLSRPARLRKGVRIPAVDFGRRNWMRWQGNKVTLQLKDIQLLSTNESRSFQHQLPSSFAPLQVSMSRPKVKGIPEYPHELVQHPSNHKPWKHQSSSFHSRAIASFPRRKKQILPSSRRTRRPWVG